MTDLERQAAELLGPGCGLNADWNCQAWSFGAGILLLDNEDDESFAVVHRADEEVTMLHERLELTAGIEAARAEVRARR